MVAVVAALLAASLTHQTLARAEDVRAAYGSTRSVWVIARPVGPGQTLAASDLVEAEWPAGMVPDDAVDDSPVGRVTRGPLGPGHAVTEWVLSDVTGPRALVPTGWRGVTVDTGAAPPPVAVGDVVDVLSTTGSVSDAVLAADAIVIDIDDDHRSTTVAVPAAEAATVASAGRAGLAVLVLVG